MSESPGWLNVKRSNQNERRNTNTDYLILLGSVVIIMKFTPYRKGRRVLFMCDQELMAVPLGAIWDMGAIHRAAVVANEAIKKMMKG